MLDWNKLKDDAGLTQHWSEPPGWVIVRLVGKFKLLRVLAGHEPVPMLLGTLTACMAEADRLARNEARRLKRKAAKAVGYHGEEDDPCRPESDRDWASVILAEPKPERRKLRKMLRRQGRVGAVLCSTKTAPLGGVL